MSDRGVVDSIRALRERRYMTRGAGAKRPQLNKLAEIDRLKQAVEQTAPPRKKGKKRHVKRPSRAARSKKRRA